MKIFHGSEQIIAKPEFGKGSSKNDYGRGFYCTNDRDLAGEWACKSGNDGFINKYSFNMDDLLVCNLNSGEYSLLNWLAILTKNRGYWQKKSIAEDAKDFLQEKYYVDTSDFDVIVGYRADDSYFSFVQDFIMGTISYQKLARAMQLGKLGEQVMLKSPKAFERIKYIESDPALADIFYMKKKMRDMEARAGYAENKSDISRLDEIYMIDIMRGRINDEDLRI